MKKNKKRTMILNILHLGASCPCSCCCWAPLANSLTSSTTDSKDNHEPPSTDLSEGSEERQWCACVMHMHMKHDCDRLIYDLHHHCSTLQAGGRLILAFALSLSVACSWLLIMHCLWSIPVMVTLHPPVNVMFNQFAINTCLSTVRPDVFGISVRSTFKLRTDYVSCSDSATIWTSL